MRRKRLIITPSDDRYAAYSAVETGDEKYSRKLDVARENYKSYGAIFTAKIDEAVSEVLNDYGVVGKIRVKYYAYARRIGRLFVKYRGVRNIDDIVVPISLSFIELYRLDRNVAAAIYDRVKRLAGEILV